MSRFAWVAPMYGYVVCIIAVITFIVNVSGFIDAAFDRANPLASGRSYGPYGGSLRSFESFRATYEGGGRPMRPVVVAPPDAASSSTPPAATADTISEAELRRRFEALRDDQLALTRHQSTQRLVKHGLLLLVAAVLFFTHWNWARRQRDGANV